MSDASHTEPTVRVEENMTPLPIPPCPTTSDAPTSPVQVLISTTFYRVREEDFPHPDKPTPSKLNDSDQENIPPSTPPTIYTSSPIQAEPLGRVQAAIPFTNDKSVNQALLSALTRVRNNVDHGSTYQLQIEEIVRIGRALQYYGTPSDNKEAALLVAQLDNMSPLLNSDTSKGSKP